ncbi:MAG: ammonium transporter, partial [Sarcina sp.]
MNLLMESVNTSDATFMIIATALVALMTPGLAFFYGGLVEKKNSVMMILQVMSSFAVVTLFWVFGGFSLIFGNSLGGFIGNPLTFFGFNEISLVINPNYGPNIPFLIYFMYQLMFAVITFPLAAGAFANRMKFLSYIKVLILWMIFVYSPAAHWIWGGGFLAKMGFVDFAGGTVIHVTAGFAALACIIYLGRRRYIGSHGNLGLVAVGTGILWFGWFGFNAGGVLAGNNLSTIAVANTAVAAAIGMLVWMIMFYIEHKHASFVQGVTGSIAGLATITPCAGYVTPPSAAIIAIIAAIFCYTCVKLLNKLKLDDALDVWGTHGMGGFLGSILIGVFAKSYINGISASFSQFFIQLFGVSIVSIYTFVVTFIILKLVRLTGEIRVS